MSSLTQLKSYQSLLHSDTTLYIQSHGDTGVFALGIQGPDSEIAKWNNLLHNFDTRPKRLHSGFDENGQRIEWTESPKSPRLVYVGPNLAYLNTTKDRLRASLRLYFSVNLPLLDDVKTRYYYDVATETEIWERDEVEIERIAIEATDHFMSNQIHIHCFIAQNPNTAIAEFNLNLRQINEEAESFVERLVDKASGE